MCNVYTDWHDIQIVYGDNSYQIVLIFEFFFCLKKIVKRDTWTQVESQPHNYMGKIFT